MKLVRVDGPVTQSGRVGPALWWVYPFFGDYAWGARRKGRADGVGGMCFGTDAEAQAVADAKSAARIMAGPGEHEEARDE